MLMVRCRGMGRGIDNPQKMTTALKGGGFRYQVKLKAASLSEPEAKPEQEYEEPAQPSFKV